MGVQHFTDKLFSFRTTRNSSLRFEAGQFVMLGLELDGRPLMRAYSMASAPYEDHLDFFSIKVPGGPLTSRLQHIRPGDAILIGRKPTGTLVLGNLKPGRRLYLLATGTGFAPFASLIRDPETYERFERVIAVVGCRVAAELQFATQCVMDARQHELVGEFAREQLIFQTTVTREPYHTRGRITELMAAGALSRLIGQPELTAADDRVMICGNPEMLAELKSRLETSGYEEGSSGKPGDFVIERAFVDR